MIITPANVDTFTADNNEFVYSFGPEDSYAGKTPFTRLAGLRHTIAEMRRFARKELSLGNTVIVCAENGGNQYRGSIDTEYAALIARCVAPNNLAEVARMDHELESLAKSSAAQREQEITDRINRVKAADMGAELP